jgi:S1-C subfamily serine protease
MASIDGKERKALRTALVEAFPTYEDLRRLGQDQLDLDLNQYTHPLVGLNEVANQLIGVLDQQFGRQGVVDIIEAARAERPSHPLLREAERLILHTADPLGDVYPTEAIEAKVASLNGLERVIVDAAGFPNFEDIVGRLGAAEFRVCLIDYRLSDGRRVCGTGFLITNEWVMTNLHVVDHARDQALKGAAIELTFGYRSKETSAVTYRLADTDWLVASDKVERLDYAVLQVQGSPGSDPLVNKGTVERGYFRLVNETPVESQPLLILQHPYDVLEGSPSTLRLTVGFAFKRAAEQLPHVIRHSANTDEGSSGSPVFSGRMDLIGLHNWGGTSHNEAISVGEIRTHLRDVHGIDLQT